MVYRFTLRMSGDSSMAEEITQEVFLAFLRQPHQFEAQRAAFSTWLCGIARRQLWKRMEGKEPFIGIDTFEEHRDQESSLGPYELLNRKDAINAVRAGIGSAAFVAERGSYPLRVGGVDLPTGVTDPGCTNRHCTITASGSPQNPPQFGSELKNQFCTGLIQMVGTGRFELPTLAPQAVARLSLSCTMD
jgi:hypothetical protein